MGRGIPKKPAKVVLTMLLPYKDRLKTITTDNGMESAAHESITKSRESRFILLTRIYPGKKGGDENANKLICRYIPKGTSFKDYPPERIANTAKTK